MDNKMCPCGNGCMELKDVEEQAVFRGVDLKIRSEKYVCPGCGIEAGTLKQAAAIQTAISNAYRSETGLLSGSEIKKLRTASGLTREQLASLIGVCENTIKGWETCVAQTRKEDKALKLILENTGE